MNKLIDNGSHTLRLHVQKIECFNHELDYFWLHFTSQQAKCKKPKEERTLFASLLEREQLTKLRDIINVHLLETTCSNN